jgi:hypothetical protein
MNAIYGWWMGYFLNLIVLVFTGSMLAALAMGVALVGFVYAEKKENGREAVR